MNTSMKKALKHIEQALEELTPVATSSEVSEVFDRLTDVWNELESLALSPDEREAASRHIDWDKTKVNTRGIPY